MNAERSQNLKKVLEAVPAGFLADAAWLTSQGLAYETFRDYVRRGWLDRVARGVFRRPAPDTSTPDTLGWRPCLLSIQRIMGYDVHVGGMTALAEQGYEHYIRLGGGGFVWVYGEDMPNWLRRLPLDAQVEARTTSLFADRTLGLAWNDTRAPDLLPWDWGLRMSTPERAVMEAMDELPGHEGFHNLDMVFQSLTTLRPKMLSALLHSCRKIKVRRLFFVFADRYVYPWRKRLDPGEFDLGSGDRALVKGGRMHPRYRIMVPEGFVETGSGDGP